VTDQRTRGISDSLLRPGAKLSIQAAHESGLIGLVEAATVSKKQFQGSNGLALTVAGGYRFGDPDAWHFGVGMAAEVLPGARFDAPMALMWKPSLPPPCAARAMTPPLRCSNGAMARWRDG